LNAGKADLEGFARRNQIRFRDDASNAALDIQRNRIRHELLPLLRTRCQPALTKAVLRLMDIIGAEAEFVTRAARRWLEVKRRPAFDCLPIAVQRRVLQLQLLRLNVPADFEVIELLRESPNRLASVSAAASVHRDDAGMVHVRTHPPVTFNPNELSVALKGGRGEIVFHDVRFRWRVEASNGVQRRSRAAGCESFDADKIGPEIRLRHWRAGDRFQPIGMSSPVKLQDWFTNQKIPRERRRELVLAATAAGEIFWVEGLRISEKFKLVPQTIRCLIWRWRGE
jgi:tRNA(Ile)-lysidine synthase